MKKFGVEGSGVFSKLAILGAFVCSLGLQAQELNCYADVGASGGGRSPALTNIDVQVDKKTGVATGRWNGQTESTDLLEEEDNLAEFVFDNGAEAGVWESEVKDESGARQWVGFILPSEDSGMYRLKCANTKGQTPLAKN